MRRPIIALIFAILGVAVNAHAKQYRCDGRIQYRPCTERVVTSPKMVAYRRGSSQPEDRSLYARVVEKGFKQLSDTDGQWKGIVEGHGKVHLSLEIAKDGKLDSRWNMGAVELRQGRRSWFVFRANVPQDSRWTWSIIAKARPLS